MSINILQFAKVIKSSYYWDYSVTDNAMTLSLTFCVGPLDYSNFLKSVRQIISVSIGKTKVHTI